MRGSPSNITAGSPFAASKNSSKTYQVYFKDSSESSTNLWLFEYITVWYATENMCHVQIHTQNEEIRKSTHSWLMVFSCTLNRIFWLTFNKYFLMDNHDKTIFEPVRCECPSCRVQESELLIWFKHYSYSHTNFTEFVENRGMYR